MPLQSFSGKDRKANVSSGNVQIVEKIDGRRKLKRGYEYEVYWKGLPIDKNEWLTRDQLEEMGFGKTLNDIDIKEAAKQGLVSRPLTGTGDKPSRQTNCDDRKCSSDASPKFSTQ